MDESGPKSERQETEPDIAELLKIGDFSPVDRWVREQRNKAEIIIDVNLQEVTDRMAFLQVGRYLKAFL
jgi:hypothetical protein